MIAWYSLFLVSGTSLSKYQNANHLRIEIFRKLLASLSRSNLWHLNKYDSHTAVWSPSLTSQKDSCFTVGPWAFWMSCVQTSTQRFNKSILPGWTVRFSMLFFWGDVTTRDLGRDCGLPWNWTGHLGFDPHGNHDSIRFKRKIWVLFQCLSFQVSWKPSKTHQPPWSGWWSSPMKRRTRSWLIYGCPVPAHFFLNGHVNHHHVVQLIYYYIFTYCFMHYDIWTDLNMQEMRLFF